MIASPVQLQLRQNICNISYDNMHAVDAIKILKVQEKIELFGFMFTKAYSK